MEIFITQISIIEPFPVKNFFQNVLRFRGNKFFSTGWLVDLVLVFFRIYLDSIKVLVIQVVRHRIKLLRLLVGKMSTDH